MAEQKYSYLTVDRVDDGIVILIDEEESIYRITADMLGLTPHDGDVLRVVLDSNGIVLSAVTDIKATEARRTAMREKLRSLLR